MFFFFRDLLSESPSSVISPLPTHLIQENENLSNDIEYWLTSGRQLINQQEQINLNTLSDNNHLLSEIQVC